MSISTFKREFEKCYSDSPMKFQNKRLETCALPNSSRTKKMHQIYLDIGYENLSSFIQAYKIKYGITQDKTAKNELIAIVLNSCSTF
jgi:AraC-like DNA-binding protein